MTDRNLPDIAFTCYEWKGNKKTWIFNESEDELDRNNRLRKEVIPYLENRLFGSSNHLTINLSYKIPTGRTWEYVTLPYFALNIMQHGKIQQVMSGDFSAEYNNKKSALMNAISITSKNFQHMFYFAYGKHAMNNTSVKESLQLVCKEWIEGK